MEVWRSLEFSGGHDWSCREGIGVVWKSWVERGEKLIGVVLKGAMELSFPRVGWRIGAVLDLYHPVFPGLAILTEYSMYKKNSQKRFHTAGARIVISSKLPSDFFPIAKLQRRATGHRSQPHRLDKLQPAPQGSQTPSFAFHKSNSYNRLQLPNRYSEYQPNHMGKLPPVCQSMEKQNHFQREPQRQAKLLKIRSRNLKIKQNDWFPDPNPQRILLKL